MPVPAAVGVVWIPARGCFGQCMMPKDCARSGGAMDAHGSGCVGRGGLIRRKTTVAAGGPTDPYHGLGVSPWRLCGMGGRPTSRASRRCMIRWVLRASVRWRETKCLTYSMWRTAPCVNRDLTHLTDVHTIDTHVTIIPGIHSHRHSSYTLENVLVRSWAPLPLTCGAILDGSDPPLKHDDFTATSGAPRSVPQSCAVTSRRTRATIMCQNTSADVMAESPPHVARTFDAILD